MPAPSNDLRRVLLFGCFGLLVAAPAAADEFWMGKAESPSVLVQVSAILAPHRNMAELNGFATAPPERCIEASRGATICVWQLSKRNGGWSPLAAALGTGDRLNLVCEVPANEGARAEDSCSVRPRRSNRNHYRDKIPRRTVNKRVRRRSAIVPRAELKASAVELLAGARTGYELSALMGDAPSECQQRDDVFLCNWRATASTYGHGHLAMSIGTSSSNKVRMMCTLPADGAARAADSCAVYVGG